MEMKAKCTCEESNYCHEEEVGPWCNGCKYFEVTFLKSKTDPVAKLQDALIDLMKRMEHGDGEVQWVSCGETVFEALWALVEESEGRERLAKEFPHYC